MTDGPLNSRELECEPATLKATCGCKESAEVYFDLPMVLHAYAMGATFGMTCRTCGATQRVQAMRTGEDRFEWMLR